MKSESMRIKEISLRQDPDLRKELALLARGCDFVLPSRFKKRLKAFQQVQVCLCLLYNNASPCEGITFMSVMFYDWKKVK